LSRGASARIDRLVPETGDPLREKLRALQLECGCKEGALLMVLSTIAASVFLIQDSGSRSAAAIALTVLAVMLSGAAVGKAIGLAVARVRLHLLLRAHERRSA
jgi:NhaP-type Na+/H+ or K+/H+ antiporter